MHHQDIPSHIALAQSVLKQDTDQLELEATDEDGGRFLSIDVGRELAYLRTGYVPDAEDITHLGDAESGRIYPAAYAPPALADALTGRDLTLTTCAEGDGVRARVLWW